MAINKKKGTPPKEEPLSTKVLSLRLPPPLRATADRYADSIGISLNGLACIALAEYLASRGYQVKS